MKVLVTGGTGFTGSHLVKRRLDRGDEVFVLDNQKGIFHDELVEKGVNVQLGSVTDKTVLDSMVEGCEVVFHLAAAFRQLNVSDQYYWNVNVEGTRNILESASRFGVRKFVYCSTQGVHGNIEEPPGSEESSIAPEDYYQYTKYEGEKVVKEFVGTGLAAVTIRPTAIYGPGDPARFLMLFRRVKQGTFLMFGDGETLYHPVYIDNLVDAFELASEKDGLQGNAYIIADEHYCSLNDLVQYVARAMGKPVRILHLPFWPLKSAARVCELLFKPLGLTPPIFPRKVDWFKQNRAFRIDKARQELGYEPKIGLEAGLARTVKWYQEEGYI